MNNTHPEQLCKVSGRILVPWENSLQNLSLAQDGKHTSMRSLGKQSSNLLSTLPDEQIPDAHQVK